MKRVVISEEQLNRVIFGDNRVDEGWLKNAAIGGLMGAATMFGGTNANAQNVQQNNKQDTVQLDNSYLKRQKESEDFHKRLDKEILKRYQKKYSVDELKEIFPIAYEHRNADKNVWLNNKLSYVGEIDGKDSIVGMTAASRGENPWEAIVQRYTDNTKQNDDNIFTLGDFDIQ